MQILLYFYTTLVHLLILHFVSGHTQTEPHRICFFLLNQRFQYKNLISVMGCLHNRVLQTLCLVVRTRITHLHTKIGCLSSLNKWTVHCSDHDFVLNSRCFIEFSLVLVLCRPVLPRRVRASFTRRKFQGISQRLKRGRN